MITDGGACVQVDLQYPPLSDCAAPRRLVAQLDERAEAGTSAPTEAPSFHGRSSPSCNDHRLWPGDHVPTGTKNVVGPTSRAR